MKYALLTSCLLLTACNSEADIASKKEINVPVGWSVTSDVTINARFTTQIIVDPQGQKFLVVVGTGIIPYKELPTTIERN